jgi:NADPH-dependent curcumin reductase CurA
MGDTIFVSAASGAVGQIVGHLAKHESLRVTSFVSSDEKLEFVVNELGFDGGSTYKNETPAGALTRTTSKVIDIYCESVGFEHLKAAIHALKNLTRVVICSLVS